MSIAGIERLRPMGYIPIAPTSRYGKPKLGIRAYRPIGPGEYGISKSKIWRVWYLVGTVTFLLVLLLVSAQSAETSEPPDVIVAEIHEAVQATCFDDPDISPLEKDLCSVRVIRTIRQVWQDEQPQEEQTE